MRVYCVRIEMSLPFQRAISDADIIGTKRQMLCISRVQALLERLVHSQARLLARERADPSADHIFFIRMAERFDCGERAGFERGHQCGAALVGQKLPSRYKCSSALKSSLPRL